MRLVRYRTEDGGHRTGLLDEEGTVREVSGAGLDTGCHLLERPNLEALRALDPAGLPPVGGPVRLAAPVPGVGKVIGVGLNYRQHAIECELPIPAEPTLFLKATSALSGPDAPLVRPRGARCVDWEVELAAVIGQGGAYLHAADALRHVAGYCLAIDFSERDFQFRRGGQGFKGKSCDGFGPLGPWLVTADAFGDPQDAALELDVNGVARQRGSTADMLFSVAELVAYASQFMSLQPGDIILTGTPAGVGMGLRPPVYLQAGDTVDARGRGLGGQRHAVRDEAAGIHGAFPC